MAIWSGTVTLTGDGDTETLKAVPTGRVIGIAVTNSADLQPDASWDLTVRNNSFSKGSTAVPNNILVDAAVPQTNSAVLWYYPSEVGNLASDGTVQTLSDNIQGLTMGDITIIGANMGASELAYITVFVEH